MKRALVIVDVQNDFLSCGALPVSEGEKIIPVINDLQKRFDLIVATQEWHPPDHISFAPNHPGKSIGDKIEINGRTQVLVPAHCLQDSAGAELSSDLDKSRIVRVFQKGADPLIDSYSGFFDCDPNSSTGLGEYLREQGIEEVVICGLPTDYFVKHTALDAKRLGFHTVVVEDACRAGSLNTGDIDNAWNQIRVAGVNVVPCKYISDDRGAYDVFEAETGY